MEEATAAINALADTDEEAAAAKRIMLVQEFILKRVRHAEFIDAKGNVAERTAFAECTPAVDEAHRKYSDAVYEYEMLKNKRKTNEIKFEAFRSINANRRQGGQT
jgi:hypothetical protein